MLKLSLVTNKGFTMDNNTFYAIGWTSAAAVLIAVAICVYKYHIETNKFLFENGYSQVQLIGSTGTMWVKTNSKGKLIDTDGKEVEISK
jgi:hypothetical protein